MKMLTCEIGFLWGIFQLLLTLLLLLHRWLWLLRRTVSQWITRVTTKTATVGQMIYNATLRVESTLTWAGIATFLLDASAIRGAIAVQDTLGSTCLVGIAKVVGQARAGANAAMQTTKSICTARIGLTGIRRRLRRHELRRLYRCHYGWSGYVGWWRWLTGRERIAN